MVRFVYRGRMVRTMTYSILSNHITGSSMGLDDIVTANVRYELETIKALMERYEYNGQDDWMTDIQTLRYTPLSISFNFHKIHCFTMKMGMSIRDPFDELQWKLWYMTVFNQLLNQLMLQHTWHEFEVVKENIVNRVYNDEQRVSDYLNETLTVIDARNKIEMRQGLRPT